MNKTARTIVPFLWVSAASAGIRTASSSSESHTSSQISWQAHGRQLGHERIRFGKSSQVAEKHESQSPHRRTESLSNRDSLEQETSSPTYSLDPNDPKSLGYYDGLRLLASQAVGETASLPQGTDKDRENRNEERAGRLGYHLPSTLTTIPKDISATVRDWETNEEFKLQQEEQQKLAQSENGKPTAHAASLLTVGTVQADGTRSKSEYLGHLTAMVPLGFDDPFFLDWAVASLLAVHHWNNGIPDVLPLLSSPEVRDCRVRFTHEYLDTVTSPREASRLLVKDVLPRQARRDIAKPLPTTILGAIRSPVTMNLATLSGLRGIPQLSHASISTSLDNPDEYPLFGRLTPSSVGTARAAASYFRYLGATHVGVVYTRDEYGESYRNAFQNAVTELAEANEEKPMVLHTVASDVDCLNTSCMKAVVKELASKDYRYYFGITGPSRYDAMMQLAHHFGIAGPGRFWLLTEVFSDATVQSLRYPKGSSLAQVTHGIGRIRAGGSPQSVEGRPEAVNFVRAWQTLNEPEFKEYFKKQQPRLAEKASLDKIDHYDFHSVPSLYAESLYDSVIAIGLATCQLTKERGGTNFTSEELFEEIKRTTFDGASGCVELDPYTGSRKHESIMYTVSNIVAQGVDSTGNVTFSVKETSTFRPFDNMDKHGETKVRRQWTRIEGSDHFSYADSSHTPPESLPPPDVHVRGIDTGVLVVGWVKSALLLVSSILCAAWVGNSTKVPVIRASQPVFLYFICGGTFAMGCSILSLSAQAYRNISTHLLDVACMSTWWLYSIGYVLVFSALFAKTLRLNMILSGAEYRRIKVTAWDVLTPLVGVLSLNVAVLTTWTIFAPLRFVYLEGTRTDVYDRPLDFFSQCQFETGSKIYAAILLAINASVSLVALFEAFKGRNIVSDFAESKYIFYVLASIIEAFALGVPVVIVSWGSPSARFAVQSTLIFVTGMSTLTLLFLPKFSVAWKSRDQPVPLRGSSLILGPLRFRQGSRFSVRSGLKQISRARAMSKRLSDARTCTTENMRYSHDQGVLETILRGGGFGKLWEDTEETPPQPLSSQRRRASSDSVTQTIDHLISTVKVPPQAGVGSSLAANGEDSNDFHVVESMENAATTATSFFQENRILLVRRHSISVFRPCDLQELYESTIATTFVQGTSKETAETARRIIDISTTTVPTLSAPPKTTRVSVNLGTVSRSHWVNSAAVSLRGANDVWEKQRRELSCTPSVENNLFSCSERLDHGQSAAVFLQQKNKISHVQDEPMNHLPELV